jgi:hypothetical protein
VLLVPIEPLPRFKLNKDCFFLIPLLITNCCCSVEASEATVAFGPFLIKRDRGTISSKVAALDRLELIANFSPLESS